MANCLHKYLTFNFSKEELQIKNEGILSLDKILKQSIHRFFVKLFLNFYIPINMKTQISFYSLTILLFISFLPSTSYCNTRKINISGIVIDSESLKPLENANLFDAKENLIGVSDSKGYYRGIIETNEIGEITFKIKVKKAGYNSFIQNEHWGNLSGELNATYYFGLKSNSLNTTFPFSELSTNISNNNYESVKSGLDVVLEKLNFEKKIENLKKGNNHIFFNLDGKFYVVSNTGWIEINSENDLISLNGKKDILAKEINGLIKRNKIKNMSTTAKANYSVEIFTK
jgi:hypothetical protein